MKKQSLGPISGFVCRTLVFLSPLLALLAAAESALWINRDALPVRLAYRVQQASAEETVYYRGYFSSQHRLFKLTALRLRATKILAIGSSRMMQLRDFLFGPFDADFYNAGGLLGTVGDLQAFAEMVVSSRLTAPRLLLVGIDPWFIKDGAAAQETPGEDDVVLTPAAHVEAIRSVLKELLTHGPGPLFPSSRTPLFGYRAIGTTARAQGAGFRKDGSYAYSEISLREYQESPMYVDREKPPIIQRVRTLQKQFSLPARVDQSAVALLLRVLSTLQEAGIEVHVILPPFSTEVYDALERSDQLRDWWQFYKGTLPALLRQAGIDVFPVCTPAELGISDLYMWDGFHPSEVCMAYVLREMAAHAEEGSLLGQLDLDALTRRIEAAALPLAFQAPPQGSAR